jgi:alkylated DNA repair dioxygenase AlkB
MSQTAVPGLFLIPNFISHFEESELVQDIDMCEWKHNRESTSKRRIQVYGPRYEFDFSIPRNAPVAHLPWYTYPIIEKILMECKMRDWDFEDYHLGVDARTEILVNEYKPENHLRFHFDHRHSFKECIFGVSLISDCVLSFQHDRTLKIIDVLVPARSLYLMTGDSRYMYKHGMRPNTLSADRRISLTFRAVEDDDKRLKD